jgi:large conductance mechanosensitive channel
MSMMSEFKSFAMKGNVLDLAVGVIIGGAFGAIVNSLVGDIITPILGILTGGIDFSGLAATFGSASIAYGKFIQSIISFVMIAWVLFMLVRSANKMKKAEAAAPPPAPPRSEVLLEEIRNLLAKR